MTAANLSDVMDGIAASAATSPLLRLAYAWPVPGVVTPCALVDYPSHVAIGATMQRGSDHLSLPLWLLVGQEYDRSSRDSLSALIAGGAGDVAAAVSGSHAWGDADVTDADVGTLTVGDITYLGLKLTVDVLT